MNNNDNVLSAYLKEINKIPLLTAEEENELAVKAANGDRIAKNKIINANLRFVVSIAKKYQKKGIELEDLISEGNIGLITAIEKFDISKGYRFISYAVWWIRQAIMKAICEKSRAIRVPLNRANEIVQIEHAKKAVAALGINMTDEEELNEIAGLLNMDKKHVQEMMNISQEMVSLDAEISGRDDSSTTLADMIEDSATENPESKVIADSMNDDINDMIDSLKPTEAKVLRMRYGLGGQKPMSLQEVGEAFDLTKERIRQIEKLAIKRMQHPTRARRLESYIA